MGAEVAVDPTDSALFLGFHPHAHSNSRQRRRRWLFGAPTSTTRAHSSRCHLTTTDACAMIPRRVFLGAAALLPLATDNAFAQAPTVTPVHVQDLPDVRLDGW